MGSAKKKIQFLVDEPEWTLFDDARHAARTSFQALGLKLFREWLVKQGAPEIRDAEIIQPNIQGITGAISGNLTNPAGLIDYGVNESSTTSREAHRYQEWLNAVGEIFSLADQQRDWTFAEALANNIRVFLIASRSGVSPEAAIEVGDRLREIVGEARRQSDEVLRRDREATENARRNEGGSHSALRKRSGGKS